MTALVIDLLLVAGILALPAAAALLIASELGVRSRPVQAVFAIGAPCLIGYAAIWLYLLSPSVDVLGVWALYGLTVVALLFLIRRNRRPDWGAVRAWLFPGGMAIAAAAFTLGLGLLRGNSAKPLATAQIRYTWLLPDDARLPGLFARQLLSVHRPLPHYLIGTWLSSDRPPLQTGLYLVVRAILPFGDPHSLVYQVTGALLQSLWMPALWCFLVIVGLPRRGIAFMLPAVLLSGFVIVNSFFVWPKLFPGAFVVLLVALVLGDGWREERGSRVAGLACGLAAGFSLLGHEGSVLALVPLGAMALVAPKLRPRLRCWAPALAAVIVLMVPWTLYQRYYDPPGTNLTKLQLAGAGSNTGPQQGLPDAITSAYGRLDASQLFYNKWSNLVAPFRYEGTEIRAIAQLAETVFATGGAAAARRSAAVGELRSLSFYFLVPALCLFALGPFAQLLVRLRRRARAPDFAAVNRVWVLLGLSLGLCAAVAFSALAPTSQAAPTDEGPKDDSRRVDQDELGSEHGEPGLPSGITIPISA